MEYDPFSYEIDEDPYPVYRFLRDHEPVYRNERLGFWALSRFSDVLEAHLDWRTFSSARGVTLEDTKSLGAGGLPLMIQMDPPEQTRLRNAASKVFTPRRIAELEPDVRRLAAGYLDPFVGAGGMDVVRDFSALLPMDVVSALLGIPAEDRDAVRTWSNDMLHRDPGTPELPQQALEAGARLVGYFRDALAERRARPRPDLMSQLIAAELPDAEGRPRPLTDAELVGFTVLLASAGNETVTKFIASAVLWLGRHPDQRELLVRDPRRIPGAVEEVFRYDPPTHYGGRVTTREVELHGRRIPAGARVLLLIGSSGRDERAFPDPDRFDVGRPIERHLALGVGQHVCLGAAVARLEVRVALEELLSRFPEHRVEEDRALRVHQSNVRGFSSLPIRFQGGGGMVEERCPPSA